MPYAIVATTDKIHPKILQIEYYEDEYVDITKDDIKELEEGGPIDAYQLEIYRIPLIWKDITSNHPEAEPDGYWDFGDDMTLIHTIKS